jgi:hypothetical protein
VDAIQLLTGAFFDLHRALREGFEDATPHLWWQPGPGLNHAGFLAWHIVRDEDHVVSYLGGEPQAWAAAGWAKRFGMAEGTQGTGFEPADLAGFRFEPSLLLEYAEATWARTPDLLSRLTPEALDAPAWPGSEWNVATQLVEGCIGHSWGHLGEIRATLGLRGWRSPE